MTLRYIASFILLSYVSGCLCGNTIPFPVTNVAGGGQSTRSDPFHFWVSTSSTGTGPVASRSDFKNYLTVNWNGPEYDGNHNHPMLQITSPNGQRSISYGSMPAAVPLENTLSRTSAKVLPGNLYVFASVYQFVTDIWHDGGAPLGYDANDMWYGTLQFTWNYNAASVQTSLSNTPTVQYADWMSHSVVQGKTLRQLAIPGTHDSGAFYGDSFTNREESVTQVDNIARQLLDGIRYFDLRVRYSGGSSEQFWIVHAASSSMYYDPQVSLQSLLDAVNSFVSVHTNEVIILDFNHFYSFTSPVLSSFARRIRDGFSNKLIPTDRTTYSYNHSNHGFVVNYYAPNLALQSYISRRQQIVIGFQPMFDNDWVDSLNTQMNTEMTINGLYYLAHFRSGSWDDTNLATEISLWDQDVRDFTTNSLKCSPALWFTGSAYSAPGAPLSPYRDSNPSNVQLSLWAQFYPNFKYANVVRSNFFTGSLSRSFAIYYSQTTSDRITGC